MSERRNVQVRFPLGRVPNDTEFRKMLKDSFAEAQKIIGPGRVLGIVSRAVAEDKETGQPVFLVTLACLVPEALQTN